MTRLLLIVCLLLTPTWATAEAPNTILEQAKQDMNAGRYSTAIESLRNLVDKEQDNYEAWFLFGVAHVHEQQYHQAIEAFRQVIALRPNLAEPHNNLAAVYNNLGDTKAAVKELETALKKRPNYIVAEENLADLYIKLALKHYRNSLDHGASSVIEQRYARLLQVRNPMPQEQAATSNTSNTPATQTEAKHDAATEKTKPVAIPVPTVSPTVNYPKKASEKAAASPEQTPPPSIAEDKSITGVLDALEAWRKAWSNQDLNAYFAAYADDFQPESRFASRQEWQDYKTRVINNKAFIKVRFDKVEVDIPASRDVATISVLQHFNSDTYNSDSHKKITMKYSPQGWKITSEVSIP